MLASNCKKKYNPKYIFPFVVSTMIFAAKHSINLWVGNLKATVVIHFMLSVDETLEPKTSIVTINYYSYIGNVYMTAPTKVKLFVRYIKIVIS